MKEGVLSRLTVFFFTCIQAFRARVTLLVPLTAPHLHELGMECVQYLPIHCEHCVGQLIVEHKNTKMAFMSDVIRFYVVVLSSETYMQFSRANNILMCLK